MMLLSYDRTMNPNTNILYEHIFNSVQLGSFIIRRILRCISLFNRNIARFCCGGSGILLQPADEITLGLGLEPFNLAVF